MRLWILSVSIVGLVTLALVSGKGGRGGGGGRSGGGRSGGGRSWFGSRSSSSRSSSTSRSSSYGGGRTKPIKSTSTLKKAAAVGAGVYAGYKVTNWKTLWLSEGLIF